MVKIGPIEKLGTVWWFELFDLSNEDREEVERQIIQTMNDFEQRYSRFREDSLVGRLNRGEKITNPDSELLDVLHIAQDAYQQTDGIFNICIGDYLEQSGYDQDYSFQSVSRLPQVPDLEQILVCNKQEIYLQGEAKIDFGGFGKGLLIDKLELLLSKEIGIKYFLINGGGDMYATSDHEQVVTIGLQDPFDTNKMIGSLDLKNQGFAASSPNVRQWSDQYGKTHNHLVGDSNDIRPTFVTAATAVEADIWATVLAIDAEADLPVGVIGTRIQ